MAQSVFFVDDEPRIVGFVTRALNSLGIGADGETDSQAALQRILEERYEVVLIDLMMPGLNGVSLLRRIVEARPAQKVIIVSALSDVQSKVRCLELGAVDYLPKPFALEELAARVRVHLRDQPFESGTIRRAGRLTLDLEQRTADAGAGPVPLSSRELDLMARLMTRPGEVCARGDLLRDVWGTPDADGNVVEACVRRLRSKLGAQTIETVRNAGYRVVAP
jgi:two-component system copper resistance phosphate regulon response regulator CusR